MNGDEDYDKQFRESRRLLRACYFAFGGGAILLFFGSSSLHEPIVHSDQTRWIYRAMIAGIALPTVGLLLEKWTFHWLRRGQDSEGRFRSSWRYRAARSLTEHEWIDQLLDGLTLFTYLSLVGLVYEALRQWG